MQFVLDQAEEEGQDWHNCARDGCIIDRGYCSFCGTPEDKEDEVDALIDDTKKAASPGNYNISPFDSEEDLDLSFTSFKEKQQQRRHKRVRLIEDYTDSEDEALWQASQGPLPARTSTTKISKESTTSTRSTTRCYISPRQTQTSPSATPPLEHFPATTAKKQGRTPTATKRGPTATHDESRQRPSAPSASASTPSAVATASQQPAATQPAAAPRSLNIQWRQLFLTYPQCHTPKETALNNIKEFFGNNLSWALVARELHEDGNPHLHCLIKLKDPYRTSNARALDPLSRGPQHPEGVHGNYQCMRSVRDSVIYCTLEDHSPAEHGINYKEVINKKNGKAAWVATRALEGATFSELVQEDPGFMLLNLTRVQQFQKAVTLSRLRESRVSTQLSFSLENRGNRVFHEADPIITWLNANIRQERAFKQRQLWVHGPANCGKTTLRLYLETAGLHIYHSPLEGTSDDLYEDGAYDLVVFDEYCGARKITWLNSFLEGAPMQVHRRYESTTKRDKLPCIILSNLSPQQCYHNVTDLRLAALLERLIVIPVTSYFSVTSIPALPDA